MTACCRSYRMGHTIRQQERKAGMAKISKEQLASAFNVQEFPRSSTYDPEWIAENTMGPHVLWLTESLSEVMGLMPGMRVLDMGCGKAISSLFLAKEFDLQVWATDLWIEPRENLERICDLGLESQVFPIKAEAHDLPFSSEFFDAIVSIDAYHYFGTDDFYLATYFSHLVKPGGQIGIVVPGLTQELRSASPPAHLRPYWEPSFWSLHSPDWWRRHWERSGVVDVELADLIPNGWKLWMTSVEAASNWHGEVSDEAEMLRIDNGRHLGLTRMVARRKQGA